MEEKNKPRVSLIKDLARKILKDSNVASPPVDLYKIINNLNRSYNIKLMPYHFRKNIDGINFNDDGTMVLAYNDTKHKHRQRFTIAHELGHILLRHSKGYGVFDLKSTDINEKEANIFAAELIIPSKMLRSDIFKRIKDPRILAQRYEVSVEAMWWQVLNSNIMNLI